MEYSKKYDIFFIHGYGGSKCSWKLIYEGISNQHNAYYYEMVGFGKKSPPRDFDYSIESQAEILSNKLQQKAFENVTIVAHSYGAIVLLVSMINYEVSPKKIILVNPLAYPQNIPFFIKFQTIPIISHMLSHILPPYLQVDSVLKRIYAPYSKINNSIRDCYISEFDIPFHREALHKTAKKMLFFNAENYIKEYIKLKSRFYIIWGEDDPLIKADISNRLKVDLSAEEIYLIPSCGHAPHEECPNEFTKEILKIVKL